VRLARSKRFSRKLRFFAARWFCRLGAASQVGSCQHERSGSLPLTAVPLSSLMKRLGSTDSELSLRRAKCRITVFGAISLAALWLDERLPNKRLKLAARVD